MERHQGRSLDLRTSQTFGVKRLVRRIELGHLWFKVSQRLFHLLRIDEVTRTTGDPSGLDWRHYPTSKQDGFVVMVHYNETATHECFYRWPRTEWAALYKDAENNKVHALDEPLFRKISDRPLVLMPNHLLNLQHVEVRSVDTGLKLWPKVASFVLTTKDPDMWTMHQRHGFHDIKVSLSEPRLGDEETHCMGDDPVEWTDACILQPCVPFDTSCPVTIFEASPRDTCTLTTDASSIKQLTVTVPDAVDDAKSPWFETGFTHLTVHFHRT